MIVPPSDASLWGQVLRHSLRNVLWGQRSQTADGDDHTDSAHLAIQPKYDVTMPHMYKDNNFIKTFPISISCETLP